LRVVRGPRTRERLRGSLPSPTSTRDSHGRGLNSLAEYSPIINPGTVEAGLIQSGDQGYGLMRPPDSLLLIREFTKAWYSPSVLTPRHPGDPGGAPVLEVYSGGTFTPSTTCLYFWYNSGP